MRIFEDQERFWEWFRAQFAVFVMLALFVVCMALWFHAVHDKVDESQVGWIRETAGGFKDALLGALSVGGARKGLQMLTGNGGVQPPPPVVPIPSTDQAAQ